MSTATRIALIGLDSSHSVEFAMRMQAADCPAEQKVDGLAAVSCLRFPTPFQDERGLDGRQKMLEKWGVRVTTDFDEAVAGCDAVMIEINDPALHLEYLARCADLGKRIFLDKPLADTLENGRRVAALVAGKRLSLFSCSALRFVPGLAAACERLPQPQFVHAFGPLGQAPAGGSVVWYGVHTFEMLQRAMGRGARSLTARADKAGVVCIVDYDNQRRGVVELNDGAWVYGGELRREKNAVAFTVEIDFIYRNLLRQVAAFFQTGVAPVQIEDAVEVMAMLDAAEESRQSGKTVPLAP